MLVWSSCQDLWTSRSKHISCRWAGRAGVFTNQWWTNSGLPASQTSLLLSGAPSTEQVGWAALISSAVLCFSPTESHRGTCVRVWDAGMHGANPPLSGNAWTVSKTLLLPLFLSMLIRRGLGWVCGGCADVIQGWRLKIHNALLVTDIMHLAELRQKFKVSTDDAPAATRRWWLIMRKSFHIQRFR